MKRYLIVFLVFLKLVAFAQGQDTIIAYYDSNWKEIESADTATYFGKTFRIKDNLWRAEDYFIGGQIQMIGFYKSEKREIRHGDFEYFYTNGNRKSKGKFIEEELNGTWKYYFENGEVEAEVNYLHDEYEGSLIVYWSNGNVRRRDIYRNGELLEGKVWDSSGNREKYIPYSRMPMFMGGEEKLYKFLRKNLKYPKEARKSSTEGMVIVSFYVEVNGEVTGVFISESVSKELDAEALRVVGKMPNWVPGIQYGEFVKVQFNLPVNFKMSY